MEYVAILLSFLALIGAGFAFLRANSSHNILSKRIEILKEKNSSLMARLVQLEGNPGKGNKFGSDTGDTERESGKRNKSRKEREPQEEPLQKQPRHEQQDPKQKQPRPDKQEQKQKQKEKQRQPQPQALVVEEPPAAVAEQPQQQKRKKENRRRNEFPEKGNNGELEKTKKQADVTPVMVVDTPVEDQGEQVEEQRRRNASRPSPETTPTPEPLATRVPEQVPVLPFEPETTPEQDVTPEPETIAEPVVFEPLPADEPAHEPVKAEETDTPQESVFSPEPVATPEPIAEAESATTPAASPIEKPFGGRRFAVIPEDGVIRMYQLQQRPHTDSFIEVDPPAEGSNNTYYRFSQEGNNDAIVAQDIEGLENAFDFEAPADPGVNRVVQQQDGLLVKVNNGWRIMEKARIDFN